MVYGRKAATAVALGVLSLAVAAGAQFAEPNGGTLEPGSLPPSWHTGGPKCGELPPWEVHEYNANFVVLRQSGCTDYEKPFLYVIFGERRAILFDTGSRHGDPVPALQAVLHAWLARNHKNSLELVVTHSHSHGDHTAGDSAVQAMQDPAIKVSFVPPTVADVQRLYGIAHWPEDVGQIDLGGRVLDAIPIPGHDVASIAIYDRQTGNLLTGDSLYPGRLYIRDLQEFTDSTNRLVRFTEGKPIANLLGCHIEQTSTPFKDYPVGTMYQPEEHGLALSRGSLLELADGLKQLHGVPRRVAYRDFSLWPVGAGFETSAAEKAAYAERQRWQHEHMWDQTNTVPPR